LSETAKKPHDDFWSLSERVIAMSRAIMHAQEKTFPFARWHLARRGSWLWRSTGAN
jgi:hypothetical protein